MTELKGANKFDYEVVKLMRLMGLDDLMSQMFEITLAAILPTMKSDDSDFSAEEYVQRILQKVDIDSLLYHMIPFYSQDYSQEEIIKLIAFYETPLGNKLVKVTPQILQESIVAFQAYGQAAVEKAIIEMES